MCREKRRTERLDTVHYIEFYFILRVKILIYDLNEKSSLLSQLHNSIVQ